MGKLIYIDDVLEPKSYFFISAKVKDPFKLVKKIGSILKFDLEVGSTNYFELQTKWDDTGEEKTFFYEAKCTRKFDNWSTLEVFVSIEGSFNKNTKEGEVSIYIIPKFITEFPSSQLTKSLWKLYYKMFYEKKRKQDLELSLRLVKKIKNDVEELLGIKEERDVL